MFDIFAAISSPTLEFSHGSFAGIVIGTTAFGAAIRGLIFAVVLWSRSRMITEDLRISQNPNAKTPDSPAKVDMTASDAYGIVEMLATPPNYEYMYITVSP